MTNPVSAEEAADVIERLNREARFCEQGSSYGRDVLAPLMRNASEFLEALTSPSAPSGWQQRIAAMDPYELDVFCRFCREHRRHGHLPVCLWQNAKDALPPSSSAELDDLRDGSEQLEADYIALKKTCDEMARELNQLRAQIAAAALPPVSEASPAKAEGRQSCSLCNGTGAVSFRGEPERCSYCRGIGSVPSMADASPAKETR